MHRASATDAVFSGGFPLTSEDCEDHVIDPFVLEPQAFHEMSLVSHAEPLEQPDRCQIARVHRSEDAMFAELLKQIVQQCSHRFGRIATSLKFRRQCDSDFGLTWFILQYAEATVANELRGREADSDLIPGTWRARLNGC